ncbi:MAG: zonular occludens toxin domain-containing protein [Pseudomonadota bacterium]
MAKELPIKKGGATPPRQPMLVVVCGETGVGKTYRNVLEIRKYVKDGNSNGKKGRKVLIFDVNDDDYPMVKTVDPRYIGNLTSVQVRRIRPITPDGQNMTIADKREMVALMVNNFRNGLLVLDDIDKYMTGAKGQTVVGLLTTNRHNGLDIMISHQSIAKVTTTEWQNCTWLRLHKQVDDVARYKNRIPNYFLVRIATFIVDEQYDLASEAVSTGLLTEDEFKRQKSFFVYVNMRKLKIRGCSKKAFIRACWKFIHQEKGREIKAMLNECNKDGSAVFASRYEAVLAMLSSYLRHFEVTAESPMANLRESVKKAA